MRRVLLLPCVLVLSCSSALAMPALERPNESVCVLHATAPQCLDTGAVGPGSTIATVLLNAYQMIVAPSRGFECPMYPHCSEYARQAFRDHTALVALWRTTDRLYRCGEDADQYRAVPVDGHAQLYDPVNASSRQLVTRPTGYLLLPWETGGPATADSSGTWRASDTLVVRDIRDDDLFRFAESLRRDGYLTEGAVEFRRLIQYYPQSPFRSRATIGVFACYYEQGQFDDAVRWSQRSMRSVLSDTDRDWLVTYTGAAHMRAGDAPGVRHYFQEVVPCQISASCDQRLMLEAFSYADEREWNRAIGIFAQVESPSPYSVSAADCIGLCLVGQRRNQRSPTLAGVLGLVPGLGYLYAGYEGTAASALVVNGLLFWGTYQAFDNDNTAMGALLGLFSVSWYSGSIYGSVRSTIRRNDQDHQRLLGQFDLGFWF